MEKIQVKLLESVGKIKFGMTREEVRKQYSVDGEFIKNEFSNSATDDLGFCHVYYDDEGKCEAVELFDEIEVYVDEKKIFPVSFETAKQAENTLIEDEEGMLSIEKSIGIYAPDGNMESILFGVKGYYEEI